MTPDLTNQIFNAGCRTCFDRDRGSFTFKPLRCYEPLPLEGLFQPSVDFQFLLQALQITRQIVRCLVTFISALAQRLSDNSLQPGWNLRVACQWNRFKFHERNQGMALRLALERYATGHHLIEHNTQGPDICSSIHVFTARLLWRHVLDRAQYHSRICIDRCWGCSVRAN